MLRSSRLIDENIVEATRYTKERERRDEFWKGAISAFKNIMLDVQPGDRMTGWEIIASLPLEKQMNISHSLSNFPEPMRMTVEKGNQNIIVYVRMIRALNKLYEWTSTGWKEVIEEERN